MSFFLAFISEKSNFDVVFYLKFYTWLFYLIIIFFTISVHTTIAGKNTFEFIWLKLYGIYIATVNTLRFKLLYYSLHIIVGQTSIIMAFKTIYISIKKFNLVFFNFHTHLNVRFCCLYQNTRIFKLFTSLHFTLMPIGSMFFEYIIYKCIVQI